MFKPLVASFSLLVISAFAGAALADSEVTLPVPNGVEFAPDLSFVETFDRLDAWEDHSSPNGVELGVENGVYRAFSAADGFVWGLNQNLHSDVILEVEAVPMSVFSNESFGVMCRADVSNNGDGYYFMVNSSGDYSIRIGQGDSVLPLVDWAHSDLIHTGIDRNTIRAACIGDYLALYVNGQLVAETHDTTYREGYAGLAIAASMYGVDVAFDNLAIAQANAI